MVACNQPTSWTRRTKLEKNNNTGPHRYNYGHGQVDSIVWRSFLKLSMPQRLAKVKTSRVRSAIYAGIFFGQGLKHGSARFSGRKTWIRALFGSKNMDPRTFRVEKHGSAHFSGRKRIEPQQKPNRTEPAARKRQNRTEPNRRPTPGKPNRPNRTGDHRASNKQLNAHDFINSASRSR